MTKSGPFISIIVPVYNVEDYICECINSMLNVDKDLIEIILIDDGSIDASGKICDYFARKHRNIFVFHQKNQGASVARNRGIQEAKGNYILFVDSDDYIESDIIREILRLIQAEPDIDVIFLTGKKVYSNGRQVYLDQKYDRSKIKNHTQEEVIKYLATLKKYPGSACTKAVRKNIIVQNNILFKEGKTSEDLIWCLKVFLNAYKFDALEENYYFYRQQREGSVTQSFNENKLLCLMEVISDSCIIAKNHQEVEEAIYSFLAYEYAIALLIYCNGKKTISKKNLESCKRFFRDYQFLLLYKKSVGVKMMRYLLKALGIDAVSKLVGLYYRIK